MRLHHVNDHLTEVDQNPLTDILAFNPNRLGIIFLGFFGHVGCQRFHVALRRAARNDHEIRHAGLAANIQNGHILGFTVFKGA